MGTTGGAASVADSVPERVSVPELVGRTLARLGVGHVFGVVGSGNFAVTNALRALGVPYTAARHEGGAATMADAYSRMSGRLGVVTTHQGCGYTNALTGIGEAAKSRTPLLVLAADAPASALRNNFRIDQDAVARSVGAVAERIHSPETAVADTARAWRTAVSQRRTVVLSLPLDVQAGAAADTSGDVRIPGVGGGLGGAAVFGEAARVRPTGAAVAGLVELLRAAQRPVFIGGRGARDAGPQLRALAADAGALLATSAVAKGLFNGDPADLGISGGFATSIAAELIAGADLVVGWGCALNGWTTRHGRLIAADARLAQVDIDEAEIGANRPVDFGVVGDCAAVAEDVRAALRHSGGVAAGVGARAESGSAPAPRGGEWASRIDSAAATQGGSGRAASVAASLMAAGVFEFDFVDDERALKYRTAGVLARIADRRRWRDEPFTDLGTGEGTVSTENRIDPRVLTAAIDDALPDERIVSVDSGNFMGYPSQFLEVPDEFGFCFTQAFQSIGLGLATAIGAAVAQPERLPVLGTGDGGFHMAIAELETAVRLRLPLVVIVYNDASYSAEVHHFGVVANESDASVAPSGSSKGESAAADAEAHAADGGTPLPDFGTVEFPDTDIAAIARGFGAEGLTVRGRADLEAVAEAISRRTPGEPGIPLVIDAKIASDGGSWWLAEAFRAH